MVFIENQKDTLLECFEILKSDYEKNYEVIIEIIGKMAGIDLDLAFSMWEYILTNNPAHISKDNSGSYDPIDIGITSEILTQISNSAGKEKIADEVMLRPMILLNVFGKSSYVTYSQSSIIAECLKKGNINSANELLQLVSKNKNTIKNIEFDTSKNLSGVLLVIIDQLKYLPYQSDEVINFIDYWIQQIENNEDKAKAKVRFLDFFIKKKK